MWSKSTTSTYLRFILISNVYIFFKKKYVQYNDECPEILLVMSWEKKGKLLQDDGENSDCTVDE